MEQTQSSIDKIVEMYQRDIDVSLIRENLKLTPAERLENLQRFMEFVEECHEAGRKLVVAKGKR